MENDFTLSSDIDALVISDKSPRKGIKRWKVLSKLYSFIGESHPFEIHLVTRKDWEKWYKRFVNKLVTFKYLFLYKNNRS